MEEIAKPLTTVYIQSLKKIPSLALSAFFCALLLKISAALVTSSTGKGSGFDDAVGLLFHYPESIKAIIAFFSAVFFLATFPLLFYPSDIGDIFRRWIVVPSLHIVEHMLSLTIGVLLAWLVSDLWASDESITLTVIGKVLFVCGGLGIFAVFCSALAIFTEKQFDEIAQSIPKVFRLPLFLALGGIVIGSVFMDFVWNYTPLVTSGH